MCLSFELRSRYQRKRKNPVTRITKDIGSFNTMEKSRTKTNEDLMNVMPLVSSDPLISSTRGFSQKKLQSFSDDAKSLIVLGKNDSNASDAL